MQISYAQNLEDYHLDLIFAGQAGGTYVDVGGGHPVADNVSFWFYLKGWHGLIIEPQPALAQAYAHIRPRDKVYQGLAGANDGTVAFHQVEGLHGLSSMDEAAAQRASQFGAAYRTIDMPVRRLDGLIAEAGLANIDFLKIDVEGAEDQVLAGLDLRRFRPKLIVIESVNPGHLDGSAGTWETPILAAGYRFAFFDNLNRFYVAEEAAEVLQPRIPKAPTDWGAVGHLWAHGRAVNSVGHADHALARILVHGLMAALPALEPSLMIDLIGRGLSGLKLQPGTAEAMAALLGTAEYPAEAKEPADLAALIRTDRFRAALGRIACFYDGGHIVD